MGVGAWVCRGICFRKKNVIWCYSDLEYATIFCYRWIMHWNFHFPLICNASRTRNILNILIWMTFTFGKQYTGMVLFFYPNKELMLKMDLHLDSNAIIWICLSIRIDNINKIDIFNMAVEDFRFCQSLHIQELEDLVRYILALV